MSNEEIKKLFPDSSPVTMGNAYDHLVALMHGDVRMSESMKKWLTQHGFISGTAVLDDGLKLVRLFEQEYN